MVDRLRQAPGNSRQEVAQIRVRHPAGGVPRQRFPIERTGIAVHAALAPGQRAQRREQQPAPCGAQPPEGGRSAVQQRAGRQRQPRRHRHDDAQTGLVLEVVRHVGIDERVDIDESEGRKQRAGKNQESGQPRRSNAGQPRRSDRGQRSAVPSGQQGQSRHQRQHPQREQVLPPYRRVDGPPRIDEYQVRGPHQLSQIKPNHPACQQAAFEQIERKIRTLRADEGSLHP